MAVVEVSLLSGFRPHRPDLDKVGGTWVPLEVAGDTVGGGSGKWELGGVLGWGAIEGCKGDGWWGFGESWGLGVLGFGDVEVWGCKDGGGWFVGAWGELGFGGIGIWVCWDLRVWGDLGLGVL